MSQPYTGIGTSFNKQNHFGSQIGGGGRGGAGAIADFRKSIGYNDMAAGHSPSINTNGGTTNLQRDTNVFYVGLKIILNFEAKLLSLF